MNKSKTKEVVNVSVGVASGHVFATTVEKIIKPQTLTGHVIVLAASCIFGYGVMKKTKTHSDKIVDKMISVEKN
jgi:uncharacterized protein (DUF697 family)